MPKASGGGSEKRISQNFAASIFGFKLWRRSQALDLAAGHQIQLRLSNAVNGADAERLILWLRSGYISDGRTAQVAIGVLVPSGRTHDYMACRPGSSTSLGSGASSQDTKTLETRGRRLSRPH